MWYTEQRRAYSSAAERAAHNRLVAGSNPAGPTSFIQRGTPGMVLAVYVAGRRDAHDAHDAHDAGGPAALYFAG